MDDDDLDVYRAMKSYSKAKFNADREAFLAEAIASDDGGWKKHTDFHWSRQIKGGKLDYWPSRKKWQFQGKIRRGDVYAFLKKKDPTYNQPKETRND